jgi:hypothetical protein
MTLRNAWLPFVLLLAVDAAPAAAADPDVLPRLIAQARKAEAVEMFTAIMSGDPPNAGFGWFHPSQSVYGWKWLAKQHGKSAEEGITKAEFHGPAALFERLDRDHDGVISAADFDWSDRSPWMRQFYTASSWFRRAESDANGRITPEKWQALYKQIARDKDAMTPEDLQTWLFPPPRQGPPPANSGMPSRATLLLGLLGSEIGSPCEGPAVGRPAPNFTLQTLKGEEYSLNQFKGVKPVVLVFGNFSCGPFRSQSGSVEDLKRRYGDRFEFLGVYVRDAHPTTGWRCWWTRSTTGSGTPTAACPTGCISSVATAWSVIRAGVGRSASSRGSWSSR